MVDRQGESDWLAELMSAIDQLSSLREDLLATGNRVDAELIVEADELLSKARRAVSELAQLHPALDADALENWGTRSPDALTIVSTVGITTILLPFVQTLIESASDDIYGALRKLVRRRRAASRSRKGSKTRSHPERIVLSDRRTDVRVSIDADVDAVALAALQKMNLDDHALQDTTLRWNPETKTWEPERPGTRVNLWLPGDPLDDDW